MDTSDANLGRVGMLVFEVHEDDYLRLQGVIIEQIHKLQTQAQRKWWAGDHEAANALYEVARRWDKYSAQLRRLYPILK